MAVPGKRETRTLLQSKSAKKYRGTTTLKCSTSEMDRRASVPLRKYGLEGLPLRSVGPKIGLFHILDPTPPCMGGPPPGSNRTFFLLLYVFYIAVAAAQEKGEAESEKNEAEKASAKYGENRRVLAE